MVIYVLPNLIYRFNVIAIKIPANYFMDVDNFILKFIWRGKIPRIANSILKMLEDRHYLTSRLTTKLAVIKTVW